MTGEITLRGEILPIGGLKEKLLAAHRGGIGVVLSPHENEKDLVEIPKNIKDKLDIVPVKWIDEVLEMALQHMPTPRAGQSNLKKGRHFRIWARAGPATLSSRQLLLTALFTAWYKVGLLSASRSA